MSKPAKTHWRIAGDAVNHCNCAWGCPCQFNALPTHGNCDGLGCWQIREGYFGDTRLDGTRFAMIYSWPGPLHEGNGTQKIIIDEQSTPDQRAALTTISSGAHGGGFLEIVAAICPHKLQTVFAPIALEMDRERRRATLQIQGIGEVRTEPIKNPVSGEEHRARIVLPDGFEFKEAEMGNAAYFHVQSKDIAFQYENTTSHLYAFDWSNE